MQAAQSLQTSQPQSAARIDWGNPLTRGLGFAWTASHPHRDLTRGFSASPTLNRAVGRYGRSARGSVSNLATFTTPGAPSSSSYTVLAFVIDDGTRSTYRSPFDSDDTVTKRFFQLRFTDTNQPQFIAFAGGSQVVTGSAKSAGPHVLVARAISQATLSVWCDGLQDATASYAVNYDQLSIANQFTIGCGSGGGTPFDGQTLLCAYWARPLSDAEIAAVSANPWQIFAPAQNHALSWPLYVASGGTTINAGPGAASANGPAALLNASLISGPAAASATGAGALLNAALVAGPGNASATGANALLNVSLIAGPGAASATGVTASIATSGSTTVSAAPAEAAAAGVAARLNASLIASPGNATADAPQAALAVAIPASPASAQATGVVALISTNGPVTVYANPGNAVADGASALILGASLGGGGPSWNGGHVARNVRKVTLSPQKVKTKRELVEFVQKAAKREAAAVAPMAVQAPQPAPPMPEIDAFDAVAAAIGELEMTRQAQLRRDLEMAYRHAFDRELARRIAKLQEDDDMEVLHLYHEHRKQVLAQLAELLH